MPVWHDNVTVSAKKADWQPCAACGDPDGPFSSRHHKTPSRHSGARWGFEGLICGKCRSKFSMRKRERPATEVP